LIMGCFEEFMEFREEVERLKKDRPRRTATDIRENTAAAVEVEEAL
jgi:hypothetical protein